MVTGNWRGVRVAEGAGFENQCAFIRTAGSNPALSVVFLRGFVSTYLEAVCD